MKKAEADAFFETRAFAAIENSTNVSWLFLKPGFARFALCALVLLAAINIYSLLQNSGATATESSTSGYSAIKKEYFSYTDYNY